MEHIVFEVQLCIRISMSMNFAKVVMFPTPPSGLVCTCGNNVTGTEVCCACVADLHQGVESEHGGSASVHNSHLILTTLTPTFKSTTHHP